VIAGDRERRRAGAADAGPAVDQHRALTGALATEIEDRLYGVAVGRNQTRQRFNDVMKSQSNMPAADEPAPVSLRLIRRQQRQQVKRSEPRCNAPESAQGTDIDHVPADHVSSHAASSLPGR